MTSTRTSDPATQATRLQAALPVAATAGSAGMAIDLVRRQGWDWGFAGDPNHVRISKGIPAFLAAAAAGGIATYLLTADASQERVEALRDGAAVGYATLGLGAAVGARVIDKGGIFRGDYPASAKLYELLGYGMNYGTVGATAAGVTGLAAPGLVGSTIGRVVPWREER